MPLPSFCIFFYWLVLCTCHFRHLEVFPSPSMLLKSAICIWIKECNSSVFVFALNYAFKTPIFVHSISRFLPHASTSMYSRMTLFLSPFPPSLPNHSSSTSSCWSTAFPDLHLLVLHPCCCPFKVAVPGGLHGTFISVSKPLVKMNVLWE